MKKWLFIILFLLIPISYSYAFNEGWLYEEPADGDLISEGADDIRDYKTAICERLDVDHEFGSTNAMMDDLTCGYHSKVTLMEIASPATVSNTVIVYAGTDNEVYANSDTYGSVQVTKAGKLNGDFSSIYNTGNYGSDGNLTVSGTATVTGAIQGSSDLTVSGGVFDNIGRVGRNAVKWASRTSSQSISTSWTDITDTTVTYVAPKAGNVVVLGKANGIPAASGTPTWQVRIEKNGSAVGNTVTGPGDPEASGTTLVCFYTETVTEGEAITFNMAAYSASASATVYNADILVITI